MTTIKGLCGNVEITVSHDSPAEAVAQYDRARVDLIEKLMRSSSNKEWMSGLDARSRSALMNNGIATILELSDVTADQMSTWRNCGWATRNRLLALVRRHGLEPKFAGIA